MVQLGIILAILVVFGGYGWKMFNWGDEHGFNRSKVVAQEEKIDELRDLHSRILILQEEKRKLRVSGKQRVIEVAKKYTGVIQNVEKERDDARAIIQSNAAAFQLRLSQATSSNEGGGNGEGGTGSSGSVYYDPEKHELSRQDLHDLEQLLRETQLDLHEVSYDAKETGEQLKACQEQIIADRETCDPTSLGDFVTEPTSE